MFKAIAIGLALIAGSNSIGLRHEGDINIDSLTDVQKAADAFFKSKIPNLSTASLASGQQNGNDFTFQYLNQNTPITLTQSKATLVDSTKNLFRLIESTQSFTGPLENGGRLTSTKKTYGIQSWDAALNNLGWK